MDTLNKNMTFKPEPQAQKDLQRTRCQHRRLRRLGEYSSDTLISSPPPGNKNCCWRILICVLAFLAVVVAAQIWLVDNPRDLMENFLASYRRHYNQIVHGRHDYCSPKMDTAKLFRLIGKAEIIHQDIALQQLQKTLRNTSTLNSIALVGGPGVGKSLFARALQTHFPWQDNIHTYLWNTYVSDEVEKIRVLRLFTEQLSNCGQNLLIVDNLTPCDVEVVNILNELIMKTDGNKKVTVLYIFRLNTMESQSTIATQFQSLQNIPNTKTINFKSFTRAELKGCILREARIANIKLSVESYEELLDTIDVERSGCKNVYAKVVAFGDM